MNAALCEPMRSANRSRLRSTLVNRVTLCHVVDVSIIHVARICFKTKFDVPGFIFRLEHCKIAVSVEGSATVTFGVFTTTLFTDKQMRRKCRPAVWLPIPAILSPIVQAR